MIAVSKVCQRSFGITGLGLQAALVVVQKMISGQCLTMTIMSTGSSSHQCVTPKQESGSFRFERDGVFQEFCTRTKRGRAPLTRRDLTHRVTMKAETPARRP